MEGEGAVWGGETDLSGFMTEEEKRFPFESEPKSLFFSSLFLLLLFQVDAFKSSCSCQDERGKQRGERKGEGGEGRKIETGD